MNIVIKENTAGIEPGIYSTEQIADKMLVLAQAIKSGERVPAASLTIQDVVSMSRGNR